MPNFAGTDIISTPEVFRVMTGMYGGPAYGISNVEFKRNTAKPNFRGVDVTVTNGISGHSGRYWTHRFVGYEALAELRDWLNAYLEDEKKPDEKA